MHALHVEEIVRQTHMLLDTEVHIEGMGSQTITLKYNSDHEHCHLLIIDGTTPDGTMSANPTIIQVHY
jgi:hypothetical protein